MYPIILAESRKKTLSIYYINFLPTVRKWVFLLFDKITIFSIKSIFMFHFSYIYDKLVLKPLSFLVSKKGRIF